MTVKVAKRQKMDEGLKAVKDSCEGVRMRQTVAVVKRADRAAQLTTIHTAKPTPVQAAKNWLQDSLAAIQERRRRDVELREQLFA